MLSTYQYPKYEYVQPPEQKSGETRRHPVVVVGAGPVGLATAIDLAQSGVPVVLLDDDDTVSLGSRGVCYAKRTLEVLDRRELAAVLAHEHAHLRQRHDLVLLPFSSLKRAFPRIRFMERCYNAVALLIEILPE